MESIGILVHYGGEYIEKNYSITYDRPPLGIISISRASSFSNFVDEMYSYLRLHRDLYTLKIFASCLISRTPPMEKIFHIKDNTDFAYFTNPVNGIECLPVYIDSQYSQDMGNYMSMLTRNEVLDLPGVTQGFSSLGVSEFDHTLDGANQNQTIPSAYAGTSTYDGTTLNVERNMFAEGPSHSNVNEMRQVPCEPACPSNFPGPAHVPIHPEFQADCFTNEELVDSEGENGENEEHEEALLDSDDDEPSNDDENDETIRDMHEALSAHGEGEPVNVQEEEEFNIPQSAPYETTTAHFRSVHPYLMNTYPEITADSMSMPSTKFDNHYDSMKGELEIGMAFKNKAHVIAAVKDHCVKWTKREYSVKQSSPGFWKLLCRQREQYGCPWMLRASLVKKQGIWKITKHVPQHYCLGNQRTNDHANLDRAFIASLILALVRTNYAYEVKSVKTLIHQNYGYDISYSKAWQGLKRARAIEYGTWETSVRKLPQYMKAIQKWNPGTVVEWKHDEKNQTGIENTFMIKHVFWAFRPSIEAFKHVRPVISVDGTHLYTKYKHKLLVAVCMDANQNILPLAFALVNEETGMAWRWFLNQLTRHIIQPDQRVCLISDRHASILEAVASTRQFQEPLGCHRYCLRHVCSNFNKRFRDQHLKDLCWSAGSAQELPTFNRLMRQINVFDPAAFVWLHDLDEKAWTAAHDGGWRCGIMTTNMSECINGVLKGVRRLPICPIVEATLTRTALYFLQRMNMAVKMKDAHRQWADYAFDIFNKHFKLAGSHIVTQFDYTDQSAEVVSRSADGSRARKSVVKLITRECSCGNWRRLGIPCSHAIKTAIKFNELPSNYVMWYYEINHYLATYGGRFEPVWDEEYWPEGDFGLVPTIEMRPKKRSGRDTTTRRPNEMDWPQHRARQQGRGRGQQGQAGPSRRS